MDSELPEGQGTARQEKTGPELLREKVTKILKEFPEDKPGELDFAGCTPDGIGVILVTQQVDYGKRIEDPNAYERCYVGPLTEMQQLQFGASYAVEQTRDGRIPVKGNTMSQDGNEIPHRINFKSSLYNKGGPSTLSWESGSEEPRELTHIITQL